VTKFDLGGRTGVTNFVTESGMYSVVMRSDSIKAKPFQKWVTSDVLPAIRKHGAYMTPETIEKVLLDPDMIISLANQLKDAREELKVAQPKLILASAIEASKDSILVGQLAKILNQNGISIGQNRLFKWMRISGYLCSRGNNYNRPTQTSMDRGLFEVQEMTISVPGRDPRISFTTKVTGKGQLYFVNRFLKNERIAV